MEPMYNTTCLKTSREMERDRTTGASVCMFEIEIEIEMILIPIGKGLQERQCLYIFVLH